ncbi:hypothetical protein ACFLTG_02930 [Chloroflexota bacterium]
MFDSEVQIRIIDLAAEWVASLKFEPEKPEEIIKLKAKRFDQAYQDIVKTVLSSGLEEAPSSRKLLRPRVRFF